MRSVLELSLPEHGEDYEDVYQGVEESNRVAKGSAKEINGVQPN